MTEQELLSLYKECRLCPRRCGALRTEGKEGVCHADARARVSHHMLHVWEEPCISGNNGSGTVFFSGCPLGCVYCQNAKISRGGVGEEYTAERLSDLYLSLEGQGAHNVNLVTPTHYLPHVIASVEKARRMGLSVPIVYNTSGYETVESLRLLCGTVDVYLTDFRYAYPKTAKAYSFAEDYPEVAALALEEMVNQVGETVFNSVGLMQKGVIVRLLLLPGHLIEAKKILRTVYKQYGDGVTISLMSQYTPMPHVEECFPKLARQVYAYEYASLLEEAEKLGVRRAYTQRITSANERFIPDFAGKDA